MIIDLDDCVTVYQFTTETGHVFEFRPHQLVFVCANCRATVGLGVMPSGISWHDYQSLGRCGRLARLRGRLASGRVHGR